MGSRLKLIALPEDIVTLKVESWVEASTMNMEELSKRCGHAPWDTDGPLHWLFCSSQQDPENHSIFLFEIMPFAAM